MGKWHESEQQRNKHEHKEKRGQTHALNYIPATKFILGLFGPTLFNPKGKGSTGREVRGEADEAEVDAHRQAEVGVGRWLGAYSRWR